MPPNPPGLHSCSFGVKGRSETSSKPPDHMPSKPYCPPWRNQGPFKNCLLRPSWGSWPLCCPQQAFLGGPA